jgi:hypothetical protein
LADDASTAGLIQIGASANVLAVPKPTSAMSIKLRFMGLSLSSLAWITYNPRCYTGQCACHFSQTAVCAKRSLLQRWLSGGSCPSASAAGVSSSRTATQRAASGTVVDFAEMVEGSGGGGGPTGSFGGQQRHDPQRESSWERRGGSACGPRKQRAFPARQHGRVALDTGFPQGRDTHAGRGGSASHSTAQYGTAP